jgi:RimJ/RimL family protein N-acetyltransferase
MPFDLQPILTGSLLELHPLHADHYNALFAVASDPLIWEQHPFYDRYKPEVFKEFFRIAMESGGAFVVLDRASGTIIGSSRYFGYNEERNEIEIGWTFLARSYWGGTVNRELKRLMLQHAFRYVGTVLFFVGIRNIRSQRAMERIGGVPAGTRTDPAGRESVIFRITASSFASGPLMQNGPAEIERNTGREIHHSNNS